MKILQQAPDVFLQTAKVSNSYVVLEEGITPFPPLESGAFTPVASNVTNNGTVSITSGTYTRVGDVVTMAFTMDVQMDVAEFTTDFNISIPIASDFTSKYQVNGVAYGNTNTLANVVIQGDQSNNLPFITVDSINIGDVVQFIGVMLQYQII
jgi:hypothetical protein